MVVGFNAPSLPEVERLSVTNPVKGVTHDGDEQVEQHNHSKHLIQTKHKDCHITMWSRFLEDVDVEGAQNHEKGGQEAGLEVGEGGGKLPPTFLRHVWSKKNVECARES